MKRISAACLAGALLTVFLFTSAAPAGAQTSASDASHGGMSISDLIALMAKKSGRKFIVEPRVQAQVAVFPDPAKLSYEEFLAVLQVYGFVAVDRGDTVMVMPDGGSRTMPVPLTSGLEKRPDAEVVTRIIHVKNMPAAVLVPLLRPLIPQFGHLAAVGCSNDLILVDRFANVKRIEAIVQAVDTGEPYKPEKCSGPSARGGTEPG
jgi:type II secretory pathway component GspD/PulD (secretin)